MKKILDGQSDEEDDVIDYKNLVGADLQNYLNKVTNHLNAE